MDSSKSQCLWVTVKARRRKIDQAQGLEIASHVRNDKNCGDSYISTQGYYSFTNEHMLQRINLIL
jgi:hypothetical protein